MTFTDILYNGNSKSYKRNTSTWDGKILHIGLVGTVHIIDNLSPTGKGWMYVEDFLANDWEEVIE